MSGYKDFSNYDDLIIERVDCTEEEWNVVANLLKTNSDTADVIVIKDYRVIHYGKQKLNGVSSPLTVKSKIKEEEKMNG